MADTAAGKFDAAQKKYLNIPFAPGEEEMWNSGPAKSWPEMKELSYRLIAMSAAGNKDDEKKRDDLGVKEFVDSYTKVNDGLNKLV
ncbi:hypothetical protein, partial [Clostridioides difficile]|uniref:hypothetical protein n=1 Tax=Clostridioides difficile TaxID=1496 RepID=UPI001A9B4739